MSNNYKALEKSIEKLSIIVNVSTGLAHPVDESRAKELFKALYQQNITFEYQEIYGLAIANAWEERHAKKLAEVAEKIGQGGRVQIKHPKGWGEPTVAKILAELTTN